MQALLKLCQEFSLLKALTVFLEAPFIRLCRIQVHKDIQKQHPVLFALDWVWSLWNTGFLLYGMDMLQVLIHSLIGEFRSAHLLRNGHALSALIPLWAQEQGKSLPAITAMDKLS